MKKVEAILTIRVQYNVPDSYSQEKAYHEITDLLYDVKDHAADEGLVTGFGELETESWSGSVALTFGADWAAGPAQQSNEEVK